MKLLLVLLTLVGCAHNHDVTRLECRTNKDGITTTCWSEKARCHNVGFIYEGDWISREPTAGYKSLLYCTEK